ncbi:uncharacterized protein V2V93DRAFT_167937 [Kockiozyma suomiensis]|uniref:uncharacterized protein n=1 Tax=Kockiozyma suomiensis TaxID=1337062 RepID=UPI003343E647
MSVSHGSKASMSMSLLSGTSGSSVYTNANSIGTGYSFQRFNALTVDDLFNEMKSSEQQYVQELECMREVHLVKELLIVHLSLHTSLTKVLIWSEEAAPIYRQYIKEFAYDPDDSEELRYLKRRPLVRLRFFAKFFKLEEFLPNVRGIASQAALYRVLVASARAKVESEKVRAARLKIDFSKVRSFDSLEPVASQINTKWINMRSYCQCRLEHRNGKSFEGLPVEIMLISEPLTSDALAICQLHELQRYLLFPTFRRADLVYTPPQDSSSLDIALKSYDESLVQFTFSSRENKDTWAAKFAEMFPPAPALPPGVKPQIASLAGLQIISADKDSNEKIQLQTDELDSELQRPRLFEEPELRPYIVQTDISPQKKRHSLFRYGSSNSISKSTTFSKPSVRFSRIVSESRISPSSSSSTLSPYRRLQQRLVEKQRSVSAIAPLPSVQSMVLKEETPSTSPELSRSPSVPPRSSSVANSRGAISERRSSLMTAVNNSFLKAKMSSSELETKKGETTTSVVIAKLKDEEPAKTEESKPKELKPKDTLPELNSASLKKPVSANSVSYKDTPAAGIYLVPMSANEGTAASPQPHLKSISSPANRESVSSITPEVFTVSPLTQEYTAESPRIEEQQSTAHRKKSSFAFGRKPKEYVLDENAGVPATRSGSVSSVFRKFTPRSQLSISGRKTPGHPADNAENDKAISAVYSRLSRRASTALTSLSPNVGSPNPATTPTVESPILSGALGSPASTTLSSDIYYPSASCNRGNFAGVF